MDEITILALSAKLLEACGQHKGNSIYSIIAELDKKPAQFHRIFSNVLVNQPMIVEIATEVMGSKEAKAGDFDGLKRKHEPKIASLEQQYSDIKSSDSQDVRVLKNKIYCYRRVLDDAEYFVKSLKEVEPFVGKEVLEIKTDKPAANLALLSHTYLISYNFPPQPFFPYSASACQRIEFFKKMDYFDFKLMFSGQEVAKVTKFRKAITQDKKAWSKDVDVGTEEDPAIRKRMKEGLGKPFNPYGMIKAMIERAGELAPGIRYEAVQRSIRDYLYNLGCKEVVHSDRERQFLINLEKEIEKTIIGML